MTGRTITGGLVSSDGDLVRAALNAPGVLQEEPQAAALAALARLEAASTDWLALAGRCEKAEAQRDVLAVEVKRLIQGDRVWWKNLLRAALAEAGLE